jgi:isopenicillin-N epimerase
VTGSPRARTDPVLSRRSFVAGAAAGVAVAAGGCERSGEPVTRDVTRPAGPDDLAWAPIRARFDLDPAVTYLNAASLGLPPREVAQAVARGYAMHSRDPLHAKHELSRTVAERTVPGLARLLGAEADEIMLTRNATEALHLAAAGLVLEPEDEVVTTTQEHPAAIKPWRHRATRHRIRVTEVPIPSPFADPGEVVDRIARALTTRTRAVAFGHVTRGGHLYPVRDLCALAGARGIATIVDGAQAVGMLPVDLHQLGCDAYAASLHKWLLGPIGTGVWYLRREARARWRSSFEPDAPVGQPGYAPGGTLDLPVRAAVDVAVRVADRIGLDAVAGRCRYLSDYVKSRIGEMPRARLVSGLSPTTSAPGSTIFVLGDLDPLATVAALDARRLHIDEHARDGHAAFRISTHYFNTTAEIDRVVEALGAMLAA